MPEVAAGTVVIVIIMLESVKVEVIVVSVEENGVVVAVTNNKFMCIGRLTRGGLSDRGLE